MLEHISRGRRGAFCAACVALALALGLAACGDDESSSESAAAPTTTTTAAAPAAAAYDGPEGAFIGSLPEATAKAGAKPKIGFLQVFGGQPVLVAAQDAVKAEIEKLGGSVIVYDAELDPQKQVSQFDQLFAQKVDAIAVMPANVDAIQRSLEQAKELGIPVVSWMNPVDVADDPNPLVQTNINIGYDRAAFAVMSDLAKRAPKSNFAILGSSIPNSTLQHITDRVKYWGEQLGLKFLGRQDSEGDLPAAMAGPASAILTKYPDVKNVVTYNDQSALAVIAAAREAGRLEDINVSTPNSSQTQACQAIEQGRMTSGFFIPYDVIGRMFATAAYQAATDQAGDLPKTIVPESELMTKDNVGKFKCFG
jgi:ABC-type sugar transport system substrate-binding protein